MYPTTGQKELTSQYLPQYNTLFSDGSAAEDAPNLQTFLNLGGEDDKICKSQNKPF